MSEIAKVNNSVLDVYNFIDGEFIAQSGGDSFANINPATGIQVSAVHAAGEDMVDRAVRAAKRAATGPWRTMDSAQRADILYKVAQGIEDRFEEFLAAEIADTGKPVSLASHIDIPRGAANFRVFADIVRSASSETFQMRTPDGTDVLNYSIRLPKGVVAVICPWNLPLLLMTWKVAPALACGNTVIVKPSEETPTTAALLGEVMTAAGVPSGVYNVVNGFGENAAGAFLTAHPDVDAITFTGETVTGEAIMRNASKGVRDVSFELGGKNPGVIFADCNLEKAMDTAVRAICANAGQVCLQTERLYVQRAVFDQFVEGVAARMGRLKPGDPWDKTTTLGPLVSAQHREKVLGFYSRAKSDGAVTHIGGGAPNMPDAFADGFWIEPTLWTGLPETAGVVKQEVFGPCAHVQAFDEEDEAVAMANASDYALCSMLWTADLQRAHRVASRIDGGTCWINSWFLRDLRTPFGGSKASGIGREGGLHSLEFYSELRNVCIPLG